MEKKELLIKMLTAIAPCFTEQGLALQQRLADAGRDPKQCSINGRDIPHAYAAEAMRWAEALADEIINH